MTEDFPAAHLSRPSQEALWDVNSSHEEASREVSEHQFTQRGFACKWCQQLPKGSFPLKIHLVLATSGSSGEGEVLSSQLVDELLNRS